MSRRDGFESGTSTPSIDGAEIAVADDQVVATYRDGVDRAASAHVVVVSRETGLRQSEIVIPLVTPDADVDSPGVSTPSTVALARSGS